MDSVTPRFLTAALYQFVDLPDFAALREPLQSLCDTMLNGSLCAMGGMTPYPVLSALNHYPADFGLQTTEATAS